MTPAHPTRDRIVRAAARLFHEQGYHATGIATVCREAEVLPGSLYHYFPSKEDLLAGVLELYLATLQEEVMDPPEAATADPVGRVFALMAHYRSGLEITGCTMGCPVGNLALEVSDDLPRVRELLDANFEQWVDKVEAWLQAAGDRLPAGVDRRALAGFVLTTMEGGIMRARAARAPEPFDRAVAQLRLMFDLLEERAAETAPERKPGGGEGPKRAGGTGRGRRRK